MTPAQVRQTVLNEIAGDWDRSNAHGVDLRKCVVDPPRRRIYADSFNADSPIELWLVLEEDPDNRGGYEIVFDELRGQFGLATTTKDVPVFLGWYGTFIDTLNGM